MNGGRRVSNCIQKPAVDTVMAVENEDEEEEDDDDDDDDDDDVADFNDDSQVRVLFNVMNLPFFLLFIDSAGLLS